MPEWSRLGLRSRVALILGIVCLLFATVAQYLSFRETVADYRAGMAEDRKQITILFQHARAYSRDQHFLAQLVGPLLGGSISEFRWRPADPRMPKLELGPATAFGERPEWFRRLVGLEPVTEKIEIRADNRIEGVLSLTFSPVQWERRLWHSFVNQASVILAAIIALGGAAAWLLRHHLKPLRLVTTAAAQFAAGRYNVRVEPINRLAPEIRHMVDTLNQVADRTEGLLVSLEGQRQATDNAALVVEWDPAGRITYANQKFCQVYGWGADEISGQNCLLTDSEADGESYAASLWNAMNQGTVWQGEVRAQGRDGRRFRLDNTVTPVRDTRGQVTKFVSVRFDVTARREAEDRLREQLDVVRTLIDAIPMPVFFKDLEGRYLGVNPAWERLFGRSREQFVGKSVFDLYPQNPEVARRHHDGDVDLLLHPGIQTYTIDIPAAKGEVRHTIYTKATFARADGSVGGIIGVINDVTERRRAEMEMIQIREAVENASDAISVCAVDGKAVFVNRAFTALTGLNVCAVNEKGGTADALGDPRLLKEVCPAVKEGCSWMGELRVFRQGGESVPVFFRANAIRDRRGTVVGWMNMMTDMTERKQTEAVTQRLGRILDQSLNEIYVFDASSLKFTQVNLGARQNLGYSLEELQSMTPVDIKPQFDRATFERLLQPVRAGDVEQLRFETLHRRRDGSVYPVQVRLQRSHTETPPVFFAVIEDITERREAQEILRQSEEKYRALVETTNDWVWEIDARGSYTYASPRVRDMLGYVPEEVLGRHPSDFMPPEEARRVSRLFATIAAKREPLVLLENVNLHKDGRPVVLETSGVPVFDKHGNYCGYRGIDRDITARRRAEDALRESEERFKSMAGNVPGMVFQIALSADGVLKFRYVSDGALALCACSPRDFVGDTEAFLRLLAGEGRACFMAALDESVKELTTWNWEGQIDTASGSKWINWRASPRLLPQGEVLWDGVAVNTSDTKAAQAALLQSQAQLQELSAYLQTVREEEKAHIAREIHDELGSMLTALKMDTYWLGKRVPEGFPSLHEKLSGMLKMVDEAVQATRRICTELRPTVLDDLGFLAALEWQVREFESRMGIKCRLNIPDIEPSLEKEQAIALFRIVQESFTNIARHAGASTVAVSFDMSGNDIRLEIRDDGRGIASDRVASPISRGIRGMFERARSLGGDLKIESMPGIGSVVSVSLPWRDEVRN
jgi:PAS domain S-box-containing protein